LNGSDLNRIIIKNVSKPKSRLTFAYTVISFIYLKEQLTGELVRAVLCDHTCTLKDHQVRVQYEMWSRIPDAGGRKSKYICHEIQNPL